MRYEVRVLSGGQLITLDVDAQHEEDAARQLRSKGYEMLSAKPLADRLRSGGRKRFSVRTLKVKENETHHRYKEERPGTLRGKGFQR
jgi:type II secretory pathway component PulF